MRISEILNEKCIELCGMPQNKKEAIGKMAELLMKSGRITDEQELLNGLRAREEQSSTAFGGKIAIPHYKGDAAKEAALAAMVVYDGVEFDSVDGDEVNLIFAIAAPNTKENIHLDILSRLSVLLVNEELKTALINAKTPEEFKQLLAKTEKA